jgi:hypothetical protein
MRRISQPHSHGVYSRPDRVECARAHSHTSTRDKRAARLVVPRDARRRTIPTWSVRIEANMLTLEEPETLDPLTGGWTNRGLLCRNI